jgi:hypothetical protein
MAIIKLNDIVTVMKDKWTFGDKFFGYTEEFNDNHNTQYPSLLVTPPTSVFPEVGLNNGWENYTFEVYFSDLYNRTQQANETIQQKWTNLQDLATEWLDDFLKYYQDTAPITAYLEDESVTIERNKEVANDQLIQLKMTFTWRVFSKCFRPQSTSPNQIPNLAVWLRADSGLTFSTPTKKVSAWADQSGNSNNVAQSTSADQPLRYAYDGASDKTRVNFDGTTDKMTSNSNCPITTDFTILTVAQANPVTPAFTNTYSMHYQAAPEVVTIGNPQDAGGNNIYSFTDGAGNDRAFSCSVWSNIDPTQTARGWVDKNDAAANKEYSFYSLSSNGYIYVRLFCVGGQLQTRATVSSVSEPGEWHNYVFTYDGSNSATGLKIYIDGVESQDSQQTTNYIGMAETAADLELGNGNGNAYYGSLDEVSMFNKELSQTEVTEIYNSGNPADINTSSVKNDSIGWWRMGDGATFPTIPDLSLASTSPNDATMTNMDASDIRAWAPTSEQSSYFSYESGNSHIRLGSSSSRLYCKLADSAQASGEWHARFVWDGDTSNYHIATMHLDSSTSNLKLQYNDSTIMEAVMSNYDNTQTYNNASFVIGDGTQLGFLDGNIQEVIVYNRALNSSELSAVKDYLNKKYKIY